MVIRKNSRLAFFEKNKKKTCTYRDGGSEAGKEGESEALRTKEEGKEGGSEGKRMNEERVDPSNEAEE